MSSCPEKVQRVDLAGECLRAGFSAEVGRQGKVFKRFHFRSIWQSCASASLRPCSQHRPCVRRSRSLADALRLALQRFRTILQTNTPRQIPLGQPALTAVVYADAFFALSKKKWSPGDVKIPPHWPKKHVALFTTADGA